MKRQRDMHGTVNVWIDEIAPCLKETATSEILDTIAFKVKDRREFLKGYNKTCGWYINWRLVPKNVEIYALALKDTREIQGLVAIENRESDDAVLIHWACAAPWNNKQKTNSQRFMGVGGHLFAIAIDRSVKYGHNGYVYGFASTQELLHHYVTKLRATPICIVHEYQFAIEEDAAEKILEVYNFDWDKS